MVSETKDSVFSQWVMSFSKTAKKRLAFMVDRVTMLSSSAANTSSVLRSLQVALYSAMSSPRLAHVVAIP